MPQITRILCAIDFSPTAERALEYAVFLAERFQADLIALHVFQLPASALPEGVLEPLAELEQGLEQRLLERLQEFMAPRVPAGQRVTPLVAEGLPYHEIAEIARQRGADLLVMGTHGRTGLSHLLLGSVAERVVRSATMPVVTVRGAGHE
jgi:nucleotide-binding universal stress UspA family protein